MCPPSGHVRHYGRQDGYLAWTVAPLGDRQLGVGQAGSEHCPWTILVEQGQRINLTAVVVLPPDGTNCVTEIIAEQPTANSGSHVVLRANVCTLVTGNHSKRHLLISTGNVLQVYVSTQQTTVNSALTVLLHYAGIQLQTNESV